MVKVDNQDDIVCFNMLLDVFQRARDACGSHHERFIKIGEFVICLQIAGEGLLIQLMSALSHLSTKATESPDLTICLWDTVSTDTPLPRLLDAFFQLILRNPHSGLTPRQEIRSVSSERVPATLEAGSGVLSMFDTQRNLALYWVRDAAALPYYERGAPARTILNWWLSQHNIQCVHAGAVGTNEGGILLTGKGGSGKSTTALACLDSELLYASDDYCLFTTEPSPHVYSLYNTAKLNGLADLERQPRFRPMVDNLERMGEEKLMIFLEQHLPHKLLNSFPLRAICIPTVTTNVETRLVPVSSGVVLKALVPTTLFQLPGATQPAFRRMTKLVKALPCYRLELGSDVAAIPGVIFDFLQNGETNNE